MVDHTATLRHNFGRRIMGRLFIISIFCWGFAVQAQETYPVNGVHNQKPEVYVFKNASIYVSPSLFQDSSMLIIQEGKVWATGRDLEVPSGAIEIDLQGKYIYLMEELLNLGKNMIDLYLKGTMFQMSYLFTRNLGLLL